MTRYTLILVEKLFETRYSLIILVEKLNLKQDTL